MVRDIPQSCFHTGGAKLMSIGEPERTAIPRRTPKKRNMFRWVGDVALGLIMKQSRLTPVSSRPLGVWINKGTEPFCSSSHISAIVSEYPPPQSSTLSPTSFTFQTRWGSRSDSCGMLVHFAHIWPNTELQPSGPAIPPVLLRDRYKNDNKNHNSIVIKRHNQTHTWSLFNSMTGPCCLFCVIVALITFLNAASYNLSKHKRLPLQKLLTFADKKMMHLRRSKSRSHSMLSDEMRSWERLKSGRDLQNTLEKWCNSTSRFFSMYSDRFCRWLNSSGTALGSMQITLRRTEDHATLWADPHATWSINVSSGIAINCKRMWQIVYKFYKTLLYKNCNINMWPGLQKTTMWVQKIADFFIFALS